MSCLSLWRLAFRVCASRFGISSLVTYFLLGSAAQAAVILPIEVMGPEGTLESVAVDVPTGQSSSVTGLWLQINNLNYEYKASIQVNSGAWIPLITPNIQFVDAAAVAYGGIGGFPTLKIIIPLPSGTVVDGNNTINFRFDHTDGFSSGYRVLKLHYVAGTSAVPSGTTFVDDDPSLWQGPVGGDSVRGKQLWQTKPLTSPLFNGAAMRAKCLDRHAADGGDLKYFNYSNKAIYTRSRFHNLSHQEAQDITAYIRTLPVYRSVTARPWNPPFQPGPGTSSKDVREWDAGAGLDAILPNDEAIIPYLLPSGAASAGNFASNAYIDAKNIPIDFPLLDWNHYLPKIHPMDSWGDTFLQSPSYQGYTEISSRLKPNDPASFLDVMNDPNWFYWNEYGRVFFGQTIGPPDFSDPMMAKRLYSLRLWNVVKFWEFNHEAGLEGMAAFAFPNAPSPWSWAGAPMLFSASPTLILAPEHRGESASNGKQSSANYFAQAWYQIQLIANDGNGQFLGNNPIDWPYARGIMAGAFQEHQSHGALAALWSAKALQANDHLPTIAAGWGLTHSRLIELAEFPSSPMSWSQMSVAHRLLLLNTYIRSWLTRIKTVPDIYDSGVADANTTTVSFADPSNIPGSCSYVYHLYKAIPLLRNLGVDQGLLAETIAWAKGLWPGVDWASDINATCVPGDLGAYNCTPSATPPSGNQPPSVDAGNWTFPPITLPGMAYLTGTVLDDGLPSGLLTQSWSKVSGPGTVTFADPNATITTASFSQPGDYTLQLTATDGTQFTSAGVTITVNPVGSLLPPPSLFSACDSNADNSTNVLDVQQAVNQAIGVVTPCTADINKDNQCNVIDVQRVVNAALGGQCVSP